MVPFVKKLRQPVEVKKPDAVGKKLCDSERSRCGNHSAVVLMAAGKLPASPRPRKKRAIPKPSAEAAKACAMEARLHNHMITTKPMRQPSLSTIRPATTSPIA